MGLALPDMAIGGRGGRECLMPKLLHFSVPARISIVPDSSPVLVEPGNSLSLICQGAGYPQPDVVWSRQVSLS